MFSRKNVIVASKFISINGALREQKWMNKVNKLLIFIL